MFLNAPENELIVGFHSQNVKYQHFGLVNRPEHNQSIQTKVMSLSSKCNEEKVQIFVLKCRVKKVNSYQKNKCSSKLQTPEKST